VADALVRRGVPFRSAHHVVGALVALAEGGAIALRELPDGAFAEGLAASDDPAARALAGEASIGAELRAAASVEAAVDGADVIGGTAPGRVQAAMAAARERLGPLG
jgi:argininosuccinate lyase